MHTSDKTIKILKKLITLSILGFFMSACNIDDEDPVPGTDGQINVNTGSVETANGNSSGNSSGNNTSQPTNENVQENSTATPNPNGDQGVTFDPPPYRPNSVFVENPTDIGDFNAFYSQDGYETINVIRMDVRVANTAQGICSIDDQSGCTLNDVLADVDGNDDFKVEIAVHASGDGLPDDGLATNATLRQRGNSARTAPQKSFRLKLDSKEVLWRNERRLQLNKNPYEPTRFKNKLSFDLFQSVPHFPSLRTQFVNLWIDNGQGPEDYGLFTHTEFVGKEYVKNRGLGPDDNLYKIEYFRFFPEELNNLRVDDNGEPLNEDNFEINLEIENGKDHSAVVRMMEAMNDPNRSFDSVLDQHFNRNNVLTWLATNLILRQADAITHNFYLYNPAGTDRFYFLPWDYDGTFEVEQELTNSFNNIELQKRKYYGYARGLNSRFVSRWYRQPGAHDLLVNAVNELRANYYTDDEILRRSKLMSDQVEPYLTRLPDSENIGFEPLSPERLVSVINQNYTDITTNYHVPMEPTVVPNPEIDSAGMLQLQWQPAFDVVGASTLTYDLIISRTPFFRADEIVFSDTGIADVESGLVQYPVNTASLPSGNIYVRVVARASKDPQRFWQTNSNLFRFSNGIEYFGMLEVILP